MAARYPMLWKENRLYVNRRLSGYTIQPDEQHPTMWRVRSPDGLLSDMVTLTRAKDAAAAMLDRDLRADEEAGRDQGRRKLSHEG